MTYPCFKFFLMPCVAYIFLVRGLKRFYLDNELRFLYKEEVLVPWYRRIDPKMQSDARDIRRYLATLSEVDESKSLTHKLEAMVENKGFYQ